MVRVGLNVTVPAAARPFLPPSNATHTQSQIRESLTFCERIAQGGSCCAIVRAITDAGFSCVIKYYELEPTTAPIPIETDELREFIREAELVASLRHDNIVRHLFHGWSGDRYCLGMPHYGTSLNNIIEQRLSQLSADESPAVNQAPNTQDVQLHKVFFTLEEIVRYSIAIAEGMSYLHSNGIIFRDLKPENILVNLDPTGTPVHICISDFGIAVKDPTQELTDNIGSPGFMAPEVIRKTPYNNKCDVYSFAMCLYNMMTLRPPFWEKGFWDVDEQASKGYRPSIATQLRQAYDWLPGLFERCCDLDPAKRPDFTQILSVLKNPPNNTIIATKTKHDKWTPLHVKAETAETLDALEQLLHEADHISLNVANESGSTPLHYFVRHWSTENNERYRKILKLFIAKGANINAQNAQNETPLFRACVSCKEHAVRALVEHGADVNLANGNNVTCLEIAVSRNMRDLVVFLLENNADRTKLHTNKLTHRAIQTFTEASAIAQSNIQARSLSSSKSLSYSASSVGSTTSTGSLPSSLSDSTSTVSSNGSK